MYQAIFFDINGVFVTSEMLSDRFARDFDVPESVFLPVLKGALSKARLPEAPPIFDSWKSSLAEWGVDLDEAAFLQYWFQAEKENSDMINYAKTLKREGMRLFAASNNFRERTEYYDAHFPFFGELFEKVYYSWRVGFVKPDAKYYEAVLKDTCLHPEQCLCVDNDPKNIEAASSLGMKGILFSNAEQAKQEINHLIRGV